MAFAKSVRQTVRLVFDAARAAIRVVSVGDFFLDISRGEISNMSHINKFGENPDVDTGAAEDIWDQGGAYVFSTTDAIDSVSSSNAGNTGDITVEGLDVNWLEVSQNVTLNGLSRVALATPLIRLNRAFNIGASSILNNAYIFEDTAIVGGVPTDVTKIRGVIRNGNNQTEQAIYSVPANKTAYMFKVTFNLSRDKDTTADVTWRVALFGQKFRVQHRTSVLSTGTSDTERTYNPPVKIPSKSDVKARCESVSVNNTSVGSTFDIVLVDN